MSKDVDWLEADNTEAVETARTQEIEFAKNYEIFVTDPRGKAIFEHWEKTLLRKVTPADATLQEYAADNAVRDFINKIQYQIELAQERG